MPAPRLLAVTLVAATAVAGLSLSTIALPADAKPKAKTYANCAALNKVYPHGVAKKGAKDKTRSRTSKPVTTFVVDSKVYQLNTRRDADKDGVACEKR